MPPSLRATYILLGICLSAGQAKALALPLAIKLTKFDTFGSSRGLSLTELAIVSVFITAIIWLVVGTYILSVITEARASAVLRSLRSDAISRLRRLHALSPSAALGGNGRAGLVPRRSIPVRRGGLAYPMASRTRWYQRRSHDALPF